MFDSQFWPILTLRQTVGHSGRGKNWGHFQIDRNRKSLGERQGNSCQWGNIKNSLQSLLT